MEWLIGLISVVAGVVTILWFIRDMRKENSKVLKTILDTQKATLEVQRMQSEILLKIEEGQRKGFQALEEGLKYIADILATLKG